MTRRRLENITPKELVEAVAKMCGELGIAGSTRNYDLYRVLLDEQQRVKGLSKK